MNIEKWTAKMQEAIQKAITMASEMGHQVVDVEHFLLALLEDNAGILYRVLSKANVNIADLQNKLNVRLQGKPIVSNVDINSIRISYDLNQLLSLADKQMHNFKDEYLSVEHLIMALFELNSSWLKEILNGYNLNKKNVKKIIDEIAKTNEVDLIDATQVTEKELSCYDLIGFASGVYYGKFHQSVLKFASVNLIENKNVFLMCILGDRFLHA